MAQSTANLRSSPNPMILIVGDSGMHKTFFLGTCPVPYVFDFDAGMAINRSAEPTIDFDTFKDTPRGVDWSKRKGEGFYEHGKAWPAFVRKLNEIGASMDNGTNKYKVLGFDSVTTMADCCMNYILHADDKETPLIQHWGTQIQLMQKVFDQMSAWPITKVFTAHIQRNTNDLTQMIEMLPLITGKLAGKIGVYFDEVWYIRYDSKMPPKSKDIRYPPERWQIQVEPDGLRKQSKTRFGIPDGTPLHWNNVKQYFGE